MYDRFFSLFISIVKSFIPRKTVTIRPRDKPWMTNSIRCLIRKRDRLLKAYSRVKTAANWKRYRTHRNLVVAKIRLAKVTYDAKISQVLSDPLTSAKKWWGIVKLTYANKHYSVIPTISDGGNLISDPKEIAGVFNRYSTSQAPTPGSDTAIVPSLVRYSGPNLSSILADEVLVYKLLSSVNIAKACGWRLGTRTKWLWGHRITEVLDSRTSGFHV